MSPYEALYGRPCRTHLCWTQVGERGTIGPEIVEETIEKIKFLRIKMKKAQNRQKSYADKRRKDLEFEVGDMVYLKMITFKGRARTSKRGKVYPRYLGPFRVLARVGAVAYKLDLLEAMDAFHNVFHVSQLNRCLSDQDVIMPQLPSDLNENLMLEARPVRVLDRMVKETRRKKISMIKVVWECNGSESVTWETEARMRADYPKWLGKLSFDELLDPDSRMNQFQVEETCDALDLG